MSRDTNNGALHASGVDVAVAIQQRQYRLERLLTAAIMPVSVDLEHGAADVLHAREDGARDNST